MAGEVCDGGQVAGLEDWVDSVSYNAEEKVAAVTER